MDSEGKNLENEHIYFNSSDEGISCFKEIQKCMSYHNYGRRHQSIYMNPPYKYYKTD